MTRIPVYYGGKTFSRISHFSALSQKIILRKCCHATPMLCPRGLITKEILEQFFENNSLPK